MGFLQAVGDVIMRDAGHAANAAQNVWSYGSLHAPAGAPQDAGTSLIMDARKSSSDPGTILNLAGNNYNPGVHTAPVKANTGVNTSGANGSTGYTTPNISANLTTTGGTQTPNAQNAALQNLLNEYNNQINTYNNYANTTQGFQNADTANTNADYNAQAKTYNDQLNQGNSSLDQQTKVLNDSYDRSLQQLGNAIRTQFQGQLNNLGVSGAGDSSAARMAAYALASEQNLNRGYMNTDLNNQLNQIGLQRTDLQQNYNDEMGQLTNAYHDQLTGIAKNYAQTMQQIESDIEGSQTAKAAAQAYLGQWAQAQVANLDSNVMQNAQALNAKYSNLAVQNPNLTYTPNYQATPITPTTVQAQQTTSQQTAPTAPLAAPGYNATTNNQNNTPLAYNPNLIGNNNTTGTTAY